MDPEMQAAELYKALKGQSNAIPFASSLHSEIEEAFTDVGLPSMSPPVLSFLALFDPKKTKKVTVDKLKELLDPDFDPLTKPEVQQQLFTQIAGKADGKITPEQLLTAAQQNGVSLTLKEAQEMIKMIDSDRDGKTSFREFQAVFS